MRSIALLSVLAGMLFFAGMASADTATLYEAENVFSGGFVKTGNDPTKTSGGALVLVAPGATATATISAFAHNRTYLRLRGPNATAEVSFDGVGALNVPVENGSWQRYKAWTFATEGSHTLSVKNNGTDYLRIDTLILKFQVFAETSIWNIPALKKGSDSPNPNPAAFNSYGSSLEYSNDTTWGKPFFFARPTDPCVVWDDLNGWASGDIAYQGECIRTPAAAHEATGSDGHLALISADRHYSYEGWRCHVSSHSCATLVRFDLSGSGVPNDTSDNTSARGSGTPLITTAIHPGDDFQHAQGCTVPNVQSDYITPPATHADGGASNGLRYGQLYRLRDTFPAPSDPIAAALVQELKTYGCYLVDQGATFGIDGDPNMDMQTPNVKSTDLFLVR